MNTKNIIVVPYDLNWVSEFHKIKESLQPLQNSIMSIEHVGSTSVEGLAAKPIIDIDVVITSYDKFDEVKSILSDLGYYHEGDLGVKDREAFKYNDIPGLMKHHLYVCPQYSEELKRHMGFRDYLRTHEADREEYGRIKLEAAKMFPHDIDNYIKKKVRLLKKYIGNVVCRMVFYIFIKLYFGRRIVKPPVLSGFITK